MLIICLVWLSYPSRFRSKGSPNLAIRAPPGRRDRPFLANDRRGTNTSGYLLQPPSSMMPSTCSIRSSSEGTPVHFEAGSSRPASRDQIRGCAVRQHPPDRSASKKLPPFSTQRSLTGMGHKGPSGSIFSSQWIKIRQNRVFHAACKLWSFSKKTEGQSPIGNRQSNIVPIRHPTGARPHAKRAVRSEATQRSRQREDKTPTIPVREWWS